MKYIIFWVKLTLNIIKIQKMIKFQPTNSIKNKLTNISQSKSIKYDSFCINNDFNEKNKFNNRVLDNNLGQTEIKKILKINY